VAQEDVTRQLSEVVGGNAESVAGGESEEEKATE